MEESETRALGMRYLNRNPLLHMDMLENIRRGNAEILFAGENGMLQRDRVSGVFLMSAADEDTACQIFSRLEDPFPLVVHQEFYQGEAAERFSLQGKTVCRQAAYQHKEPIPEPESPAEIRQLSEDFLPFVFRYYSHHPDEEYLLERLRAGVMFGAFVDGEPAGFMGMHEEGSMGMLEVLPQYRRLGIASALGAFYTNRLLARGMVPYSQIIEGNTASLELHRKMNFSVSEEHVCWMR